MEIPLSLNMFGEGPVFTLIRLESSIKFKSTFGFVGTIYGIKQQEQQHQRPGLKPQLKKLNEEEMCHCLWKLLNPFTPYAANLQSII